MTTMAEFSRRWGDVEALRWMVVKRLTASPGRVAQRSRETSTHFKWLLATDRARAMRIWLHEFKPSDERRAGYASSVHNHRYPFRAIALQGGYTNRRYDIGFDAGSLHLQRCELVHEEEFGEGVVYTMAPDEYHSVETIEEGTQSLVMELPPVAAVSYSIDQRGDRMIQHVPLEERIKHLVQPTAALLSAARVK